MKKSFFMVFLMEINKKKFLFSSELDKNGMKIN